ncbi:MAG: hypothetical protein ABWK05_08880 [Pyrobaculum sp.]
MKVFLVGNVEEPIASLLKIQGFEIMSEPPTCKDCFVLYIDDCDAAMGLGLDASPRRSFFNLSKS